MILLLVMVPDGKLHLAALEWRAQVNHQGQRVAVVALRVAMSVEKVAGRVQQHTVKSGFQRVAWNQVFFDLMTEKDFVHVCVCVHVCAGGRVSEWFCELQEIQK